MGCFERLVKSHFLTNISAELSMARQAVGALHRVRYQPAIIASRSRRRALYAEIVYAYYFLEDMIELLSEDNEKMTIYYCQIDHYIFMYSRNKKQLTESVRYNYNLNGDACIYQARHKIANQLVYTALIDTRMQLIPASVN